MEKIQGDRSEKAGCFLLVILVVVCFIVAMYHVNRTAKSKVSQKKGPDYIHPASPGHWTRYAVPLHTRITLESDDPNAQICVDMGRAPDGDYKCEVSYLIRMPVNAGNSLGSVFLKSNAPIRIYFSPLTDTPNPRKRVDTTVFPESPDQWSPPYQIRKNADFEMHSDDPNALICLGDLQMMPQTGIIDCPNPHKVSDNIGAGQPTQVFFKSKTPIYFYYLSD